MVWINDSHINSSTPKGTFGGAMCTCLTCTRERELNQFKNDRNEALLSLDHNKIIDYMKKYNIEIPRPEVFWVAIHKSITANTQLPLEFRRMSKHYLKEGGFESLDDGDL